MNMCATLGRSKVMVCFTFLIVILIGSVVPVKGVNNADGSENTTIWGVNQYYGSGRFNDAINSEILQLTRDAGLQIIGLWAWSPRTQDEIVRAATLLHQYNLEPWICLPRVASEARTLVQRLGSLCNYYEVLKEPHVGGYSDATPEEYVQIWRDVVSACREVNPNAWYGAPVVGSPRTSPRSVEWMRVWLEECKDMIDPANTFISYHSFTCHGSRYTKEQLLQRAEDMHRDDLIEVRELCREILGYELKIAVTEFNWTSDPNMARWDLDEAFIDQWTKVAMRTLQDYGAWAALFWWLGGYSGWDNTMSILNSNTNKKPQYNSIKEFTGGATPPPPPQPQYGTVKFSAWDGDNWITGATLTMTFPDGTVTSELTPYYNTQAPVGSYTVKCTYSGQTADNSPYIFTLAADETKSHTFNFAITPPPSPTLIFEDNFDSGDFSKWNGTRTSSGETASVVGTLPYYGSFHGMFTSDDDGEADYASCYRTIDEEEVWASGHFYVASGLPLDNDDDRFYLIHFTSGRNYLAGVGIRRHEGSDKWVLYGRNGSGWVGPVYSMLPAIEMNRWYVVELHWKKHGTHGVLEALVDGERILLIEDIDTARLGNVSQINFGLTLALQVQKNLDVYGDCFSFMGILPLTSPIVVSRDPGVGATGVPIATAVQVTFSGPMDRASTEGAFSISPSVSGSFGWSLDNTTMCFTPASPLAYLTGYTVTITTDAMDQQGENMTNAYSWGFTTSDVNGASYVIGDINQDGSVNIADLYIVGLSAGSTPDNSRWNPIADLNKDGVINILDLVLVAMNFGS